MEIIECVKGIDKCDGRPYNANLFSLKYSKQITRFLYKFITNTHSIQCNLDLMNHIFEGMC